MPEEPKPKATIRTAMEEAIKDKAFAMELVINPHQFAQKFNLTAHDEEKLKALSQRSVGDLIKGGGLALY